MKNSTKYTFFGSLIIPENDFIFKKRQKFNMFGKLEGFSTHTCLFLTPMAKKPGLRFLSSAFVLFLLAVEIREDK